MAPEAKKIVFFFKKKDKKEEEEKSCEDLTYQKKEDIGNDQICTKVFFILWTLQGKTLISVTKLKKLRQFVPRGQ